MHSPRLTVVGSVDGNAGFHDDLRPLDLLRLMESAKWRLEHVKVPRKFPPRSRSRLTPGESLEFLAWVYRRNGVDLVHFIAQVAFDTVHEYQQA